MIVIKESVLVSRSEKFISEEWLKNRNFPINSLAKKYKVQRKTVGVSSIVESRVAEREKKSRNRKRGPSRFKIDQKVIRGIDANTG